MKRSIYKKLVEWKTSPKRKPMMLYGARQVGKTYILKEFGRREFTNMVYVNCYKNTAVQALFAEEVNVERIMLGLSALTGEEIKPQETLVFIDEVQDCPEAVATLKYFCENAPEICIATAGSLLGVLNMEGISFPTGKVDILHMYPMTFDEFLEALGEEKKLQLLYTPGMQTVVNNLLPEYIALLRQYYFVGGMPEVVKEFIESANPDKVRKLQTDLLGAYEADIAKHAGPETQRVRMVFQSIPSQLARENKKFIFGAVRKGARAAEFDNAIQWLVDAGLVYKVCRLNKVAIPLKFYEEPDAFKLFILDVGLLGAMVQAPPASILIGNSIFSEYKGAFTENYVLTQMMALDDVVIGYYSKANSTLEIDFIVQLGNEILPIEVKAEENVRSKSMRQFITVDHMADDLHGYRFSMKGYQSQDWISNIPLFALYGFLAEKNDSSRIMDTDKDD